jgi:hypothetical protein
MLSSASLRFIESQERYSTYQESDGTEIYIAHGSGIRLVEFDSYNLDWVREQWNEQTLGRYRKYRLWDDFLQWLREHVTDPDEVDDLRLCEYCEDPVMSEDGESVASRSRTTGFACQSCIDDAYAHCYQCGDLRKLDDMITIDDESVCSPCRDDYYSFCETCDSYYHNDDSEEHSHDGSGCCESPALRFAIRNNGQELQNDERVTVTLPAGHLDDEGISNIKRYLRLNLPDDQGYSVAALVDGLGREWQTREGNLTKRLSRAAYRALSVKLPPAIISQVGSIASDHSRAIDFAIETSRDLNMSSADWYHEDSCWWGSYSSSRCALKSNGGFGLRTFDEYDGVAGRAWVMPLKRNERGSLAPTFNTETPDAFVVFNGYGDLGGYNAARIMSHMSGMTYRKISFSGSPMYVNGDSAYIVAPEEVAAQYNTGGALSLSTSEHSDLYRRELTETAAAAAIPAQRDEAAAPAPVTAEEPLADWERELLEGVDA